MKTKTQAAAITNEIASSRTADQAAEVGMGVITVMIAVSGLWGAACLLSAMAQFGVPAMARGWLGALLGG